MTSLSLFSSCCLNSSASDGFVSAALPCAADSPLEASASSFAASAVSEYHLEAILGDCGTRAVRWVGRWRKGMKEDLG